MDNLCRSPKTIRTGDAELTGPSEELIHDETTLHHPVYTVDAFRAQAAIAARNARPTRYCGAWMKNGFHEDGLGSAVDVANLIASRDKHDGRPTSTSNMSPP